MKKCEQCHIIINICGYEQSPDKIFSKTVFPAILMTVFPQIPGLLKYLRFSNCLDL